MLIHIQIFSLYATLSSSPHKNPSNTFDGFPLPSRNLWKFFEESVTMDLCFSHFSVLLRTTLNYFTTKIIFCCLPKGFLPQETLEQGDLSLLKFSPRRPLSKKDPLAKNNFVQVNVSPCLARVHVVWQSTDTPEFNYLGNLFKKMWWPTDKKSSSSETLLLINLLMFLVSVQTCAPLLKTKAYYVALSSTLYYMLTDH